MPFQEPKLGANVGTPTLIELDAGKASFSDETDATFPPDVKYANEPIINGGIVSDKQAIRCTKDNVSILLVKGATKTTVLAAIERLTKGV